jgi:hypothetical protein
MSTFGTVSVVQLPPHMYPSLTCPKSAAAVRLVLGLWSSVAQSVVSRDALSVRLKRLKSRNKSRLADLTAIRGQRNHAHSSHDLSRGAYLWKSCEAHGLQYVAFLFASNYQSWRTSSRRTHVAYR